MTIFQAVILGLVQGLTEFLPISSSGHLVLFQEFFAVDGSVLTFDVVIHLATLLAIIIFFGTSLMKLTRRELILLGIGTIPAVIVGVLLKDVIGALFVNDRFIGLELIVTGLINFYMDRKLEARKKETVEPATAETQASAQITPLKSLLIGIAQAVAIIPGISRSGSTVATGIGLGVNREQAFRFSFLLAIPALLGAGVLELFDVMSTGLGPINIPAYVAGAVAAFIAGLLSLYIFKYVIVKARLEIFGWYCVVLGLIVTYLTFF